MAGGLLCDTSGVTVNIVLIPLLAKTRPKHRSRSRPLEPKNRSIAPKKKRVDAATLASTLQLQEQQRELIYSLIALAMKLGLLFIGTTSLFKLGIASHQRIGSYSELSAVLNIESVKLNKLQERFDRFFTIGGERRLMDENDQWLSLIHI